jgi:hypothetical protein
MTTPLVGPRSAVCCSTSLCASNANAREVTVCSRCGRCETCALHFDCQWKTTGLFHPTVRACGNASCLNCTNNVQTLTCSTCGCCGDCSFHTDCAP